MPSERDIMKNKITLLFFILIYFNQSIISMPQQCIYYLTRESWHLNATQLSLVSFFTLFAWYVKPIFGFVIDKFPLKEYHSKYYLYINYIIIIIITSLVVIFGLNLVTLILSGLIINICTAFNDVANDKQMVILEQQSSEYGSIQAIQWISMGVGGLIVSIFGAWLAKYIPMSYNYKIAYVFTLIVPIFTLYYLKNFYVEKKVKKDHKSINFKQFMTLIKNKSFLFGLLFISCLNFCPSFGTALTIQMREVLHIDKMFIGYLGATGTMLGIIGYGLYYWKAQKYSLRGLLYFTIIFSAITNLFYLYIPNQWFILSYSVLFGAFGGICFLSIMAYMASIVPKGAEGLFYALVVSVSNLSAQLGNVFGGIIYDNFGYSITVIVSTITTILCIFLVKKLNLSKS